MLKSNMFDILVNKNICIKINFIFLFILNIGIREFEIIDPLVNTISNIEFITTCTDVLLYVHMCVCACLAFVSLVKYELHVGGDFVSLIFFILIT